MMSIETLDITEARSKFTTLDRTLRDSGVIWITRHNKKAFAVVSNEVMETFMETLDILKDPEAMMLLQKSLEDIRKGDLIDHEDLKEEMKAWKLE
jgi:PHD/YefM family antitoxin component YafN of YafNO toxin-antitoxin module